MDSTIFNAFLTDNPKTPELLSNIQFSKNLGYQLNLVKDLDSKDFFDKKFKNHIKTQSSQLFFDSINDLTQNICYSKIYEDSYIEVNSNPKENNLILNIFLKQKRKYDFLSKIRINGENNLNIKLGGIQRELFGIMDTHKLQYDFSLYNDDTRRRIQWKSRFPFLISNNLVLKFFINQKEKNLAKNINENVWSEKISINNVEKDWNFNIKRRFLQNKFIIKESTSYEKNNFFNNDTSYNIKFKKIFADNITKNGLTPNGTSSYGSVQVNFSDNYANFIKFQIYLHKYFSHTDPKNKFTLKYKYINIENITRLGFIHQLNYNKELLVNNSFIVKNLKGFKNIKNDDNKNHENFTAFKLFGLNSFKINFYDYPLFSYLKIVPFIHLNIFSSSESIDQLTKIIQNKNGESFLRKISNNLIRGSFGFGISKEILGNEVEVIWNVLHCAQKKDIIKYLQISIGK